MTTIENGEEAIERIESHQNEITLIFLDLLMPKKNGLEWHEMNVFAGFDEDGEAIINILGRDVTEAHDKADTTPAGGTVTMELRELPADRPGYVLYQTKITDTGIGMAEDNELNAEIAITILEEKGFEVEHAEDVHAAKTVGMNEHIAKPLNLNTLAKTLNRWL